MRRELDGRAAAVADWLRGRMAEREVWLASELHHAATAAGIDLPAWLRHPWVAAVAERRSWWGGMAPDGVWCYVRPDAAAMDDFAVS